MSRTCFNLARFADRLPGYAEKNFCSSLKPHSSRYCRSKSQSAFAWRTHSRLHLSGSLSALNGRPALGLSAGRPIPRVFVYRSSTIICRRLGTLMPKFHVIAGPDATPAYPIVRKIGTADLKDALAKGVDDFLARASLRS